MRLVALLVFCVVLAAPALAHRVNIFAYVEGEDVVVECSFSRSNPVRKGRIEVRDDSGQILVTGQTDQAGHFRFPVPPQAVQSGSGLTVRVLAGEGHQNEWIVDNSELTQGAMPASAPDSPDPQPGSAVAQAEPTAAQPTTGLTRAEMEDVINAALDAKLAPIKRAVLEKSGPGMTEIIGGIGWILGLVGLAAYFKGRPRV